MKGTIARVVLPVGFAGLGSPDAWPRPRSARPERLDTSVQVLHGVGPTLVRRLARIGLRTVGDLLWQRPRRYEEPAPSRRVSDLFGEEEAVIDVVVRSASSRRRGRLKILTARVADDTGEIKATWFNQPWLAEKLSAGTRIRLRGRANRYTGSPSPRTTSRATAPLLTSHPSSGERGARARRSSGSPRPGARARARRGRTAPGALLVRTASSCGRSRRSARPRALDEAEVGRMQLAFDELLVLRLALARTAAERERVSAAPRRPRRAPGSLSGVSPSRSLRSGALDRRDRPHLERSIRCSGCCRDVGSGKTVVAVYALLRASSSSARGRWLRRRPWPSSIS